jgi:cation transport ATPase
MDIDKLKTRWKKSSSPKLEDSSLDEATLKDIMGKRYNYLFLKILIPELMLAAVYLFLLVFLVVFFHFFSTFWLQVLAVLAISLLIGIPVLSLTAFFRYYHSGKPTMAVGKALAELQKYGQFFLRTQYLLRVLHLFLMADLIALVPLVYSENLSTEQILVSLSVGAFVVLLLSTLIWRYHKKKIKRINEFVSRIV